MNNIKDEKSIIRKKQKNIRDKILIINHLILLYLCLMNFLKKLTLRII